MGRGRVRSPRKKSTAVKTLASSSRTCNPSLLVCASLHLLLLRHHLHPNLFIGGGLLPSRSSETELRGCWDREDSEVRRRLALILLSPSPNPHTVQRRPQSLAARSRGGEEVGGRALGSGGRRGEASPHTSPAEHLSQSPRSAAPTAVAGGEKKGRRGGWRPAKRHEQLWRRPRRRGLGRRRMDRDRASFGLAWMERFFWARPITCCHVDPAERRCERAPSPCAPGGLSSMASPCLMGMQQLYL